MTSLVPDAEVVSQYLYRQGWTVVAIGALGRTWKASDSEHIVVVPSELDASFFEWSGVVERIADGMAVPPDRVEQDLAHMYVDTTEFRALSTGPGGSINLDAGVALVASAKAIVRSSATTSRVSRLHIGTSFSTVGDRIAAQARMGHTRDGSYVVPILMPLPRPVDSVDGQFSLPDTHESKERRATRTIAQTLSAIASTIVEPAIEPRPEVLAPLAASGVSRESVVAVHRVISSRSVDGLGARFGWAGGLRPPPGLPESTFIPSEAAPLLQQVADLMKGQKSRREEHLTGVIVQLRDEHDGSAGEFALETVRNGRACEVNVVVTGSLLQQAHSWFREGDALLVRGRIDSPPGRPLRILHPEQVVPVADTRLL